MNLTQDPYNQILADLWSRLMRGDRKIKVKTVFNRIPKKYLNPEDLEKPNVRAQIEKFGYYDVAIGLEKEEVEVLEELVRLSYLVKEKKRIYHIWFGCNIFLGRPELYPDGEVLLKGPKSDYSNSYDLYNEQFKIFKETASALEKDVGKGEYSNISRFWWDTDWDYETDVYTIKNEVFDAIDVHWDKQKRRFLIFLTEPYFQRRANEKEDRKNWKRIGEIPQEEFLSGFKAVSRYIKKLDWKKTHMGIIKFDKECYFIRKPEDKIIEYQEIPLKNIDFCMLSKFSKAFDRNKKSEELKRYVKKLLTLWAECNNAAKQINDFGAEHVFTPTTKVTLIASELPSEIVKNQADFDSWIDKVYKWIYEASGYGKRLPEEPTLDELISNLRELRAHADHDREHGKTRDVRRKYKKVGAIYQRIIRTPIPKNEKDWYLIQAGILIMIDFLLKSILKLLHKRVTDNESSS